MTKKVIVPKGTLAVFTENTMTDNGDGTFTENKNAEFYVAFNKWGFKFVEAAE